MKPLLYWVSIFALLAHLNSSAAISFDCSTRHCLFSVDAKADSNFPENEKYVYGRKKISGLGSAPPRCNGKCGRCSPCKAVHVAVPPGTPVTAEYFPEAWRCKCGNRLYMP